MALFTKQVSCRAVGAVLLEEFLPWRHLIGPSVRWLHDCAMPFFELLASLFAAEGGLVTVMGAERIAYGGSI